jgi:hypothetical protein
MRKRSNPADSFLYPQNPHEVHFTLQEIAADWKVDAETVRKAFIGEPGVLNLGDIDRRDGARQYLVLRVPESVLRRVYKRRTQR